MGFMEGLSGWLKQIIAVMLLATLVDLLLPNKTMQRYVRLVAGLFILLTVATPALQWMQGDFSGKLAAGLKSVEAMGHGAEDGLAEIEKEAGKLKERQREEAAQLMAVRLEESIRSGLEQIESGPVSKVDVAVERQAGGGLSVKEVKIVLTDRDAVAVSGDEAAGSYKPVTEVRKVAPVTVEIPQEQRNDHPAEAAGDDSGAGGADLRTGIRIRTWISARYGIPADRIQVVQAAPDNG